MVDIYFDDYWANKILGELDESVEYNIIKPEPKIKEISESEKKTLEAFDKFLTEKNKDVKVIMIVEKHNEDIEISAGNVRTVEVSEVVNVVNKRVANMYDIWDAQLERLE